MEATEVWEWLRAEANRETVAMLFGFVSTLVGAIWFILSKKKKRDESKNATEVSASHQGIAFGGPVSVGGEMNIKQGGLASQEGEHLISDLLQKEIKKDKYIKDLENKLAEAMEIVKLRAETGNPRAVDALRAFGEDGDLDGVLAELRTEAGEKRRSLTENANEYIGVAWNIFLVLYEQGKLQEAKVWLLDILKVDPKQWEANEVLWQVEMKLGNTEEAKRLRADRPHLAEGVEFLKKGEHDLLRTALTIWRNDKSVFVPNRLIDAQLQTL